MTSSGFPATGFNAGLSIDAEAPTSWDERKIHSVEGSTVEVSEEQPEKRATLSAMASSEQELEQELEHRRTRAKTLRAQLSRDSGTLNATAREVGQCGVVVECGSA